MCRKKIHTYDKTVHKQCPECKRLRRTSVEGRVKNTEEARLWRLRNMSHVRSYRNSYKTEHRREKKLRTPSWADLEAIKRFYDNCPPGHEVDHIVPYKGKSISGLHVLENLQYLPILENRRKGNRYEGI